MKPITRFISEIFNPQKPNVVNFETLVKAVDQQAAARITKVALFALSTAMTTATIVLSEADVIAWPITLAAIAVTLMFSALFVRLNHIDSRYLEFIDDQTRANLVKDEIEKIFHGEIQVSNKELEKSLKSINRVLGNKVFDQEKIKTILDLNTQVLKSKTPVSLAFKASENMAPLEFSCSSRWEDPGQFGLPACTYEFSVSWSPIPGQTQVVYQCRTVAHQQNTTEPTEVNKHRGSEAQRS